MSARVGTMRRIEWNDRRDGSPGEGEVLCGAEGGRGRDGGRFRARTASPIVLATKEAV